MESPSVRRWIVGIVGGLLVFLVVSLVSSHLLTNIAMGYPPYGVILGVFVPLLLGLLAGVHSCRVSLRSFRLDSGDHAKYPPGHCQNCGYNLTGNVSGVCPECGTEIKQS